MSDTHTAILRGDTKTCSHCGATFFRDKRNTWAYWERAKFCGHACSAKSQAAAMKARRGTKAEEFARWFERSDGCWLWKAAIDRDGYGIFSYVGKTYRAAKIALELDDRAPKVGEYACHHCDNPQCVRPDHLYPGTPTQNSADKIERGRQPYGEDLYNAKLTAADVIAIRADLRSGSKIAADYGVTQSNITAIKARKTWRHLS